MKIIVLIASHIDCQQRLHHFVKLIKSINEQVDYHDEIDVRISLSNDVSINRNDAMALINLAANNKFNIFGHNDKLSQFEHYKFLLSQLDEYHDEFTWILFSDDDDEWAQNRIAAYHYMAKSLYEKENEYYKTTSICYTDNATKTSATYIGNYVDYCVKLKYFREFFVHATPKQLKHKYCDCYFVRFICSYGSGDLKKAFCATDDILYHWIKRDKKEKFTFPEAIHNNLDLYMAQYSNPNAKDWLNFCFLYCENYLENKHITNEAKKLMVKIFLENYQNHIFASKIN